MGLKGSIRRRLYSVILSTTPSPSPGPEAPAMTWGHMCRLWRESYLFLHRQAFQLPWGEGLGADQRCCISCFPAWNVGTCFLELLYFILKISAWKSFFPLVFHLLLHHWTYKNRFLLVPFSLSPSFPSSHHIIKSPSRLSSPYHFKWIEKRSDFLPLCLPKAEFQNERKVLFPLPFYFILALE